MGKTTMLAKAVAAANSEAHVIRLHVRDHRGMTESFAEALAADVSTPVLIVADDVHLASLDDQRALARLCAGLRQTELRVIAAMRPWPETAAQEFGALARHGEASVVHMAPLSDSEAADLLQSRLGVPISASVLQVVVRLCAGTPLLLTTVASVLAARPRDAYREDDVIDLVSQRPEAMGELLGIDGSARACLEAASVFGMQFRPSLAIEAAGLEPDIVGHNAVDGLCRLGILRQGPGRTLEFVHPLVQRVVYAQLTPPTRSRLHALAYSALAGRGFERRAAEHAMLADLSGDDAAIQLLARVGRAEMHDGSADLAARRFRAAIDLASDHATPELRLALAEALIRGGQPLGGVRILERMIGEASTSSSSRLTALHLLADSLAAAGDLRGALLHLQLAAELARSIDTSAAAGALLDAALLSIRMGDVAGARNLVWRAQEQADANTLVAEQATFVEALIGALSGDPQHAATVEKRGLEIVFRSLSDPTGYSRPMAIATLTGIVVTAAGRIDPCATFLPAAIRALRPRLGSGSVAGLLACQADALLQAGRLEQAAEVVAEAVTASDAAPGFRPMALAVRARILFHQGALEECASLLGEIEHALSAHDGLFAAIWTGTIRAALALVEGRTDEAAARYAQVNALIANSGLGLPGIGDWATVGAAGLVRGGDVEAASETLARADAASGDATPHARVVACVARGLLREHGGMLDEAEAALNEAVNLAAELPGTLRRIVTVWVLSSFLRRHGRDVQARRLCVQARDLATTAHAVTLRRLIEAELGAMSGRRGRASARIDGLTPREARVVELARLGRTNREIAGQLWISINTVETHLQRAFAKLGVKSRAELARVTSPNEIAG